MFPQSTPLCLPLLVGPAVAAPEQDDQLLPADEHVLGGQLPVGLGRHKRVFDRRLPRPDARIVHQDILPPPARVQFVAGVLLAAKHEQFSGVAEHHRPPCQWPAKYKSITGKHSTNSNCSINLGSLTK